MVHITIENIEEFRGDLTLQSGDLPYGLWQIFNRDEFEHAEKGQIVPIANLVSNKNQLLDPKYLDGKKLDPRLSAFQFMVKAANGEIPRRGPLTCKVDPNGMFLIQDGNATAQALMLVGWRKVPIQLV